MTDQKYILSKSSGQEEVRWYAIRAFKRKVMGIREDFEKMGFKTYIAMRHVTEAADGRITHKDEQIIPQLLFVCCSLAELDSYKREHDKDFMIYRHKVLDKGGFPVLEPAPIPEEQMKTFMFITSTGDGKDVEYYADIMPHFEEGERVVVKDGIYKGLEGFVKRIKRDRKLLVALEGVAVVAISNIPMSYLEKKADPPTK